MSKRVVTAIFRAIEAAILSATIYCAVSLTAYGLRHPELTQTQILLDFVKALRWK